MSVEGFKLNQHGFDWSHQRVTLLFSHKGSTCLRVLNKVNGQFVDIQTSEKGRKNYVTCGSMSKDELAHWLDN